MYYFDARYQLPPRSLSSRTGPLCACRSRLRMPSTPAQGRLHLQPPANVAPTLPSWAPRLLAAKTPGFWAARLSAAAGVRPVASSAALWHVTAGRDPPAPSERDAAPNQGAGPEAQRENYVAGGELVWNWSVNRGWPVPAAAELAVWALLTVC